MPSYLQQKRRWGWTWQVRLVGTPRSCLRARGRCSFCRSLAAAQESGADPFEVFPIAIHCELKKTHHVFYLSRVDANGVATYISPSRAAGTITVDGAAQRIGGDQSGSCKGKTLEQLRESKQTLDVSR
ncbi:hypothetical protein [Ancylobacter sonchi]|uniref:hypothetical protein n=1 Tax=Ancylobacter sonchi TaxID=1937790 RepID=UPI0028AD19F9|nr:hypothetical protein [Ancylobacter sonchi]